MNAKTMDRVVATLAAALAAQHATVRIDDHADTVLVDGMLDLREIVRHMSEAEALPERGPLVMAIVRYSDEEFLAGIGTSKDAAYRATFEAPDIHESHRGRETSFLRLDRQPSGWSTDTGQNVG